jgi:hypothetical protein
MRTILATAALFFLQSRSRLWFAVIAASVLFGLFEFAVSSWLLGVNIAPNLHAALQASIVGLGAGFALWLILLGIIDRRRIVADELHRLAELNHTIRNYLEVMVLAHYTGADCEHKAMVLDCTNRIDQQLTKLFPVIGKTARNAVEPSAVEPSKMSPKLKAPTARGRNPGS